MSLNRSALASQSLARKGGGGYLSFFAFY
jgi:hypothetical protein